MIKLVVTDIDGTILIPEKGINDSVKQCLRELKEKAELIISDMNDTVRSDFNSVSNKKIIEFEEYANQLFEKINMNHKEVVFLYDMLNDKADGIKVLYDKLQEKERIINELLVKSEGIISETINTILGIITNALIWIWILNCCTTG